MAVTVVATRDTQSRLGPILVPSSPVTALIRTYRGWCGAYRLDMSAQCSQFMKRVEKLGTKQGIYQRGLRHFTCMDFHRG